MVVTIRVLQHLAIVRKDHPLWCGVGLGLGLGSVRECKIKKKLVLSSKWQVQGWKVGLVSSIGSDNRLRR